MDERKYFSWLGQQPQQPTGSSAKRLDHFRRKRDAAQAAWDKLSDARLASYEPSKRLRMLAEYHWRLLKARITYEQELGEAREIDVAEPLSRPDVEATTNAPTRRGARLGRSGTQHNRGARKGARASRLSRDLAALIPLAWTLYDAPTRGGYGLPDSTIHELLRAAELPAPPARQIKRLRLEYRRP